MKQAQNEQWSTVIKQRRLKWFGHLLRLPDTCPARLAYKEAVRQTKQPRGRSTLTQIKRIDSDLRNIDTRFSVSSELIVEVASDSDR